MGRGIVKDLFSDMLRIIYPDVCEICGTSLVRGEHIMCLKCDLNLPRTKTHNDSFNIIHQRLAGNTPINRAAGYFYYYKESDYASLIHKAKYNGQPAIATYLAKQFAQEIIKDGFFNGIDLILPVPLHLTKLITREYNQSEYIAKGISSVTQIPVGDNIVATRKHATQTKKNSYDRWLNAQGLYKIINATTLENKHILIVDDVITTGATLLSCCDSLHRAVPSATISVLSLAVTHLH